ncbi:MAG: trypsin-like peptidase domain-containing protein [Acidobacteria bacterium]|nr:trypsin-like peptidase domain-containing protein [Acidobacteriota bacterium]
MPTCRCGCDQPADAPPIETRPPESQPASGGTRSGILLVIGLFLGLGLASAVFWSPSSELAPEDESTPAATTAAPPDARPPATTPPPAATPDGTRRNVRATTDAARDSLAELRRANDGTSGRLDANAVPPASPGLEDLVADTLPSVVSIQAGQGRGTGFFVRRDTVLTNAHVVGANTSVQLTAGGRSYSARVARISTSTDLAVLQVTDADVNQPALRLGTATGLRAGQEVIAIGSAMGVLSNTVTRGIVSAVRQAGAVTLIQTDAAINPGNSGGPLIDRAGVVIGVNSMRIAAADGGEGIAFAVAIDHAVSLLDGQPSAAAATPLQGLDRLMQGAPPGSDDRAQANQVYARELGQAARVGADIDTFWENYAESCVASAVRTGDRPWFAVYEPDGVRLAAASAYDCSAWLSRVLGEAERVSAIVRAATEAARRQGVYPGVMRDLRQEHRLEWAGWER